MRIIITGGHLTPAYSFCEIANRHSDNIIMIGSQGINSTEAIELKQLNVGYHTIKTVKFDRFNKFQSVIRLPFLIVPIIQSYLFLAKFKPDVICTFGSFNAVPVHMAGWLLGIPAVLHEQTRGAGLANKIIASYSKVCCISYPESSRYFPVSKVHLVGNILRSSIWNPPLPPPISTKITPSSFSVSDNTEYELASPEKTIPETSMPTSPMHLAKFLIAVDEAVIM